MNLKSWIVASPAALGILSLLLSAGFADPGKGPAKTAPGGPEAICGADDSQNAACFAAGGASEDLAIYGRSRAVARLKLGGGVKFCTGWLVGCEGHLITTNECIDDPVFATTPEIVAANAEYEFLLETPTCAGGVAAGSIWGGAATLIARDVGLDYALIQLAGDPQNTYGSFALDNRAAIPGERIYVPQHPGGGAKEIASFSTDPSDPSGFCEVDSITAPTCPGGTNLTVGYFCDTGGSESEGSPVVAYSSQRVIALHQCAVCPNRGVPITDVITSLGGTLPACALSPLPILDFDGNGLDDSFGGNNDGVADPGETLILPVNLFNLGSGDATVVSATLSTATPLVTVIDATADWPGINTLESQTTLSPHYTVALDPSFSCGDVIDFDLAITTNEGPFNASFQLPTGTNAAASIVRSSTDTPFAIPDDDPGGITSTLAVPDNLVISDVHVSVDITHTWIGDLIVELTSPASTTVRLHDRTGGPVQDIVTTYDLLTAPDGPGSMGDLDGENAMGNWELFLSDNAFEDLGILHEWSLTFEGPPSFVCTASAGPVGGVPDGDTVPGTQLSVVQVGNDLKLDWDASCRATDTDYEVYEGSIAPGGSFSSHVPRTCSTGGLQTWTGTPGSGDRYYLVVPTNGPREGSYGVDSGGAERGQGAAACLGQETSCP